MSKQTYSATRTNKVALFASFPTTPLNQKQPETEKRFTDPSSTLPRGQRYPIPSFFEYRSKPKEFDSL